MALNSSNKTYLLSGVALALLSGFAAYTVLDKTENLVPVVVATQNIPARTQVTERMVKIENVPALARSENSIDDTGLVIGGYTTTRVFANQTIIQPMVAKQFDETGASGLALAIPDENLRAVSFPTDPASTVNGQIKKGDYIDVIVSLDKGSISTNSDITKTILQGVEVFDTNGEGDAISNITLLLTLEQAEIMKHAYRMGEVTYTLNPGNAKQTRTTGIINKNFCERYNFNCVQKQ